MARSPTSRAATGVLALVVVALVMAATLAACSSGPTAGIGRLVPQPGHERGVPAVPAPATVPTPYASLADADLGYGTDAEPGRFPRTLRHALGETEVVAAPSRVVALDLPELDALVQLGVVPVGAVDLPLVAPHLAEAVDGVTSVGSVYGIDLDALADLDPDLIVANATRHGRSYDELSAIAPTVLGGPPGVAWQANVALVAQATGREAVAAELVAAYERRVDELAADLPVPRPSVSVVRAFGDQLRYYQRASFPGTVLADLGLHRPPAQDVDDFAVDGPLATVATHAGADLVVRSAFGAAPTFVAELEADPAWLGLAAVRDGRVVEVDDATWISGIGYGSIPAIHADLRRALVDGWGADRAAGG